MAKPFRAKKLGIAVAALGAMLLAGCTNPNTGKEFKPVPRALVATMERLGMSESSQVFIRIFKESSELEVWKQQKNGSFALLKTYEICKWSGVLGPKIKEGDRQAPEGFYTVTPAQMNPKSNYYLSFNIGFPNKFDQSHNRTGSHLMVHGACSSAGCYSMTDEAAGELFALARDSFRGGQTNFQIQAFPFRMTPENMARHADNQHMPFWRMLKEGYDHFELTKRPPKVDVCDRRYVFNADAGGAAFNSTGACPAYTLPSTLAASLKDKQTRDQAAFEAALASIRQKAADRAAAEEQAAAKAAERERAAAERAAQPSMMTRILQGVGLNQSVPSETPTTGPSADAASPG